MDVLQSQPVVVAQTLEAQNQGRLDRDFTLHLDFRPCVYNPFPSQPLTRLRYIALQVSPKYQPNARSGLRFSS